MEPATLQSAPGNFSDETIREATLADRQDILDLDTNVYYGLDYLRNNYNDVIRNPQIKAYVYEKKGKVVGFFSARLVDGGQSLLVSSGRLGLDSRGGGMYGRFKKRVFEEWKDSPDLRHVTMTINNYNFESKRERLLRDHRQVLERDITVVECNLQQIRSAVNSRQGSQLQSQLQLLSYDDVNVMMRHQPSQLRHLFPEDRILLQWCPLRIIEVNTKEIYNGKQKILANKPAEPISTTVQPGKNFPVTFMSAGGHYSCKRGQNYDVDVYGSGSDEDLRAHMEWHLLRLAEVGADLDTAVMRVYHTRQVEDIVEKLKKEFSVQISTAIPFRKVFALEMDYVK
ncbi:probable N-acetyltransferase 16 isoform X2 [Littorina saxatilis]